MLSCIENIDLKTWNVQMYVLCLFSWELFSAIIGYIDKLLLCYLSL